jgi:hypothetical protein
VDRGTDFESGEARRREQRLLRESVLAIEPERGGDALPLERPARRLGDRDPGSDGLGGQLRARRGFRGMTADQCQPDDEGEERGRGQQQDPEPAPPADAALGGEPLR